MPPRSTEAAGRSRSWGGQGIDPLRPDRAGVRPVVARSPTSTNDSPGRSRGSRTRSMPPRGWSSPASGPGTVSRAASARVNPWRGTGPGGRRRLRVGPRGGGSPRRPTALDVATAVPRGPRRGPRGSPTPSTPAARPPSLAPADRSHPAPGCGRAGHGRGPVSCPAPRVRGQDLWMRARISSAVLTQRNGLGSSL